MLIKLHTLTGPTAKVGSDDPVQDPDDQADGQGAGGHGRPKVPAGGEEHRVRGHTRPIACARV